MVPSDSPAAPMRCPEVERSPNVSASAQLQMSAATWRHKGSAVGQCGAPLVDRKYTAKHQQRQQQSEQKPMVVQIKVFMLLHDVNSCVSRLSIVMRVSIIFSNTFNWIGAE